MKAASKATIVVGFPCTGPPENDRPSSVDEKSAEVAVAPLGDSTHVSLEPARVLPGRETKPARQVSPRREAMNVSDEGEERGGSQETNARDGL